MNSLTGLPRSTIVFVLGQRTDLISNPTLPKSINPRLVLSHTVCLAHLLSNLATPSVQSSSSTPTNFSSSPSRPRIHQVRRQGESPEEEEWEASVWAGKDTEGAAGASASDSHQHTQHVGPQRRKKEPREVGKCRWKSLGVSNRMYSLPQTCQNLRS